MKSRVRLPGDIISRMRLHQIVSYLHLLLISNVLHRRHRVTPRRPTYLLIVGSDYCVMCFAYGLHMCRQNLVLFPCLYSEPFELVIEIVLNYCTTPPCHNINLFKHPFRGSRFERLDDAFVLLVSPFPLHSANPHFFQMTV